MLFMKGNPDTPRCGFSRKVVDALNSTGISYGTFDILGDEFVRQGLKQLSSWPTYPQVGRADVPVAQIRGHKIWTAEQCMPEAPAHSFAVQYSYWGHGLNIGTCQ
jgi:hypothetical protein